MARHEDLDHNGVADYAEIAHFQATRATTGQVLYGVDIHPTFQAGISIDQIAAEGFSFLAVKASQGARSSWAPGAKTWLDRADQLGLITWCYHYLTTDDVTVQAQTAKAASYGRPVMVDVEDGSGDVNNLRAFLSACASSGVRVPLVYLPRWYWQKIGSPSLSGLPPIVSSRYLTVTGYASSIYAQVPASFWDSYGGATTTVLQFTDRATVAGYTIDADAFRGTKDQLRELVYGPPPPAVQEAPVSSPLETASAVWTWPIDDPYTAQTGDTLPAYSALAWAATNAAHARDEAAAATQAVADLTAALRTAGVIK